MRLIDADKLKVEATKQFSYPDAIIALVNTQPTAYDVDKVVEMLENKCHNCFGAANNDCRFCGDDGK